MDFDKMMDNAACCCQNRLLLDSEELRECIKLNVYQPMADTNAELLAACEAIQECGKLTETHVTVGRGSSASLR